MAIYHFSSKIISRSAGRSAVAAAAYRSASCLLDERIGRSHDFTAKAGVVHSEIMLPAGAPGSFSDRSVLWNAVEAGERRKDSQLSRDIEISLPAEMSQAEAIALARGLRAGTVRGSGDARRSERALGEDGAGGGSAPRPYHAHHAIGGCWWLRAEGFGLEPQGFAGGLAGTLGGDGQ